MHFCKTHPSVYHFHGRGYLASCHLSNWSYWGWCSLEEVHECVQNLLWAGRVPYDHYELLEKYGFERNAVKGRYSGGLLLLDVKVFPKPAEDPPADNFCPVPFECGISERLRAEQEIVLVPTGWAKQVIIAETHFKCGGIGVQNGKLVAVTRDGDKAFDWGKGQAK